MGILDSAQDLLNRGMAATERGTRMVSLKAQLGDAERQRDKALLAFGGSLYEAAKSDASLRSGREELFDAVEGAYRLIDEISHSIIAVEDEGRAARAAAEQAKAEAQARVEAQAEGRAFACPACGAAIEAGYRFCSSCGAPLAVAVQDPVDPAFRSQAADAQAAGSPSSASEREAGAEEGATSPISPFAPVYDPAPEPSREAPAEIAPERVTTVVDK